MKKILFSLLPVFLLLLATEGIFRAVGFSYTPPDTGFEITPEYRLYQENGDQYVSFKGGSFPVKKDSNEIRLFLIGGSSVENLKDVQFLSDILKDDLPPGKNLRIINFGRASFGTTRLLINFQEVCDYYDPDIFLIYSGHNEFEEEYIKRYYRSTFFSNVNDVLMKGSRSYQFLAKQRDKFYEMNIGIRKKGNHPFLPPKFTVKWDITFDKEKIYRRYEENLTRMIKMAGQADAEVLLSTVAYNRRCPPFKPENKKYDSCDSLLKMQKGREALECYDEALNDDLQPHRATLRSNSIIIKLADEMNVPFIHADSILVEEADLCVPGYEMFSDHCHIIMNSKAERILLEAFHEGIVKHELLKSQNLD